MAANALELSELSEEKLLQLRLCELNIGIKGTWLEDCVNQLYRELDEKGISFKPPCYLADEWLTPDGEPVIGIAFYLAHPALMRLEKKMMLEAEGETKPWCMMLLRHETGHAINYAYKLYRRKKWQKIFGRFSKEYGDSYRFRPYSKNFVRHLEDYYAQYHPDEDFAETFAVWLDSNSNWQQVYKGWKVMRKLNYVDEVINEIRAKAPLVAVGKRYWEIRRMKTKLHNFYKKKMRSYADALPNFHDENLKKIFSTTVKNNAVAEAQCQQRPLAAAIIKKHKKTILNTVAQWTGARKYIIGGLIEAVIERCRSLSLCVQDDEAAALLRFNTYVTALVMNYLHTGGFKR